MNGVSIVICCHNSRNRILPTLQHLHDQKTNVQWDIIVVDNNCEDNTSGFVMDAWRQMNSAVQLKIVQEKKPGLKYARETGIRASEYDFIIFCDDDNHLAADYVDKVYSHFSNNRSCGLIGGMGVAVSEVPLPEWFKNFETLFAIGNPVVTNGPLPLGHGYVYGAGMAMRKESWDKLNALGFKSVAVDRKGKELSGGHDVELSHALRLIGYQVIFDANLRFEHYMEANRLTTRYLLALARGSAGNFISFVYFLLLQRNVTSGFGFAWAYWKRVVSEVLSLAFLKFSPLKDPLANEVQTVMTRSALSFLTGNFFPAFGYFRHARSIHKNSQAAQ